MRNPFRKIRPTSPLDVLGPLVDRGVIQPALADPIPAADLITRLRAEYAPKAVA